MNENHPPIALTGIGAISCYGIGASAFCHGIATGPAPLDPSGPYRGIDVESVWQALPSPRLAKRIDISTAMAIVGGMAAVADAGVLDVEPDRCGVVAGSTFVGLDSLEHDFGLIASGKGASISAFSQPRSMVNAGASHLAIQSGFTGPTMFVGNACASGNTAVYLGQTLIRSGVCDVVLCGGWDGATGRELITTGLANLGVQSEAHEARPFDAQHDGVVLGEGSGFVVLERMDRALERNARIYASLLGAATNCDAGHITTPDQTGNRQASCIRLALKDAGVSVSDVALVSAHGNATPFNDDSEARALTSAFGESESSPMIYSYKGATGHTWGAAGVLGVIAIIEAMKTRVVQRTWGFEAPSESAQGLDVVTEPREWSPGISMSNAFGFGGHNTCVVVAPHASLES